MGSLLIFLVFVFVSLIFALFMQANEHHRNEQTKEENRRNKQNTQERKEEDDYVAELQRVAIERHGISHHIKQKS